MEPGGPVTRTTFGASMSVRKTFSSPGIESRNNLAHPAPDMSRPTSADPAQALDDIPMGA
jgi:hypothetical protein